MFPAVVQGKESPATVIEALKLAAGIEPHVIALVRGGGSALDLDAFNDLDMCRAIADSPVPVLTGIGHETDLSVADMVAHSAFKTPTAVADLLVERSLKEWSRLVDWTGQMQTLFNHRLAIERQALARHGQTLRIQPRQQLHLASTSLNHLRERLQQHLGQWVERQAQQLARIEASVQAMNPSETLKRGFSVVRVGGQVVKRASDVQEGSPLTIQLHQGTLHAIAKQTES